MCNSLFTRVSVIKGKGHTSRNNLEQRSTYATGSFSYMTHVPVPIGTTDRLNFQVLLSDDNCRGDGECGARNSCRRSTAGYSPQCSHGKTLKLDFIHIILRMMFEQMCYIVEEWFGTFVVTHFQMNMTNVVQQAQVK